MVKPEQIVALCVRLFAIVLGFNALRSVASMLIIHSENSGIDKYQIAIFSFLVTMLFIVVMLWIFPNIIAKKIIPVGFNDISGQPWSVDEMYGCGFVLLGTFFLFKSLSNTISFLMYVAVSVHNSIEPFHLSQQNISVILIDSIEIFASLALIIGSRGITRLIFKIRYGGSSTDM